MRKREYVRTEGREKKKNKKEKKKITNEIIFLEVITMNKIKYRIGK